MVLDVSLWKKGKVIIGRSSAYSLSSPFLKGSSISYGVYFQCSNVATLCFLSNLLTERKLVFSCHVFDLDADGQVSVKFGVLFADEKCANLFEALVGTLKAAKRRKIVTYQGELLLQGVHDNVDIVLLQD